MPKDKLDSKAVYDAAIEGDELAIEIINSEINPNQFPACWFGGEEWLKDFM